MVVCALMYQQCACSCSLHRVLSSVGNKIRLERAEDGSGRGAALVAAVAVRMKGQT